jgi:hypothetical protein
MFSRGLWSVSIYHRRIDEIVCSQRQWLEALFLFERIYAGYHSRLLKHKRLDHYLELMQPRVRAVMRQLEV